MHQTVRGRSRTAEFADEHNSRVVDGGTALIEGKYGDVRSGYDDLIGLDATLGPYVDADVQRPVERGPVVRLGAEGPHLPCAEQRVSCGGLSGIPALEAIG